MKCDAKCVLSVRTASERERVELAENFDNKASLFECFSPRGFQQCLVRFDAPRDCLPLPRRVILRGAAARQENNAITFDPQGRRRMD